MVWSPTALSYHTSTAVFKSKASWTLCSILTARKTSDGKITQLKKPWVELELPSPNELYMYMCERMKGNHLRPTRFRHFSKIIWCCWKKEGVYLRPLSQVVVNSFQHLPSSAMPTSLPPPMQQVPQLPMAPAWDALCITECLAACQECYRMDMDAKHIGELDGSGCQDHRMMRWLIH